MTEERFKLSRSFPQRALRTCLLLLPLAVIYCWRWGGAAALGMAAGGALMLGMLALYLKVTPALIGETGPSRGWYLLLIMKTPLLIGLIYLLVGRNLVNPVAFCAGVGLAPAVMVLKAIGGHLFARRQAEEAG